MSSSARWALNHDGTFRFEPDAEFWRTPAGSSLQVAIQSWGDLVTADSPSEPTTLTLGSALWERVAADARAGATEGRAVFATLVPQRKFSWEVSCSSFVGASRLDLRLARDGDDAAAPETPLHEGSPPAFLTPEAWCLGRLIAEWNARPAHPVTAQLELVAELQSLRDACVAQGEPVALEAHLDEFRVRRADAIQLSWEQSPRRPDFYDLAAQLKTPDGSSESLDLGLLDGERPVARVSSKDVVLLDDESAKVLRHVRARQQSRSRRELQRVLHDPAAALPDAVAPESIDLSEYSHRVTGFEAVVRAARAEDIHSSGVRWFDAHAPVDGPFLELDVTSGPTAPPVRLSFPTPEAAVDAHAKLSRELERTTPATVKVAGAEVIPTAPLRDRLGIELDVYRRGQRDETEDASPPVSPPRLAAIIDEDAVFKSPEGERLLSDVPWDRVNALLRPEIALKEHQRGGLAWLWYHLRRGTPGVLLADDMGLGKTLQVSTLLALARSASAPSLVVAPLALLENWASELSRFFVPEAHGDVVVLYGPVLDDFRTGAGLDLERLRRAGLVITNYETLARYQVSLLKLDWNIVVLDESHGIKNPDALRSRAAYGLKRSFAVAMTGTPVENRLLDLWSLFFFLSPRDPFGTREEFNEGARAGARFVREALRYPSVESRVLRRSKAVLDLPPKVLHEHDIPMTREQAALERNVVKSAGPALAVLNMLRKLYAHPLLLRDEQDGRESWSLESALQLSPKFARCLELLEEIRERGEKVLIFSQLLRMQALLRYAIRERFGLAEVGVINGDSNQGRRTGPLIEQFSRSRGFDVLILSPIAAGVGLNIVAANHVIHYDRWWNPAKEDQATDRAYRIGQTRSVNVHYLLLHDPENPSAGFDRRLHELVSSKRELARDFLSPSDAMEPRADELLQLFRGRA